MLKTPIGHTIIFLVIICTLVLASCPILIQPSKDIGGTGGETAKVGTPRWYSRPVGSGDNWELITDTIAVYNHPRELKLDIEGERVANVLNNTVLYYQGGGENASKNSPVFNIRTPIYQGLGRGQWSGFATLGSQSSPQVKVDITINLDAINPPFIVSPKNYYVSEEHIVLNAAGGTEIYYLTTDDGSEPSNPVTNTSGRTRYSDPIVFPNNAGRLRIHAVAYSATDNQYSTIAKWELQRKPPTPRFNLQSNTNYSSPQKLQILVDDLKSEEVEVYFLSSFFTGEIPDPDTKSLRYKIGTEIEILDRPNTLFQIKAIAYINGVASEIVRAQYFRKNENIGNLAFSLTETNYFNETLAINYTHPNGRPSPTSMQIFYTKTEGDEEPVARPGDPRNDLIRSTYNISTPPTILSTSSRFTRVRAIALVDGFYTIELEALYERLLRGTNAADTLNGSSGKDRIFASPGNDTINGGAGIDRVFYENGGNFVISDVASTFVVESPSDDRDTLTNIEQIQLSNSRDQINYVSGILIDGSAGIDTITFPDDTNYDQSIEIVNFEIFQLGNMGETATGSDAKETINGGAGNDTLNGGGGADSINGEGGDDHIINFFGQPAFADGGTENDRLSLANQGITLLKSSYKDIERITGGAGSDHIFLRPEVESVSGGNGADTFSIALSNITIIDFVPNEDIIDFSQIPQITYPNLTITQAGANITVEYTYSGTTYTITLENVTGTPPKILPEWNFVGFIEVPALSSPLQPGNYETEQMLTFTVPNLEDGRTPSILYTFTTNGDTPPDPRFPNSSAETYRSGIQILTNSEEMYTISAVSVVGNESNKNYSAVLTLVFTRGDTDGDLVLPAQDIDDDNDGLIEIHDLTMLHNMRYNRAGTSYDDEADDGVGNLGSTLGAPREPTVNCQTGTNLDASTNTPFTYLCGYELSSNLSFDKDEDGSTWTEVGGRYVINPNDLADPYFSNEGWLPIASRVAPFSGIFDGNGYTIDGLTIITASDDAGFFSASTGQIRNLHLRNILVTGNTSVGGIVGYTGSGGSVTASSTTGRVESTGSSPGGLVGSVENGGITGSFSTVEVNSSNNAIAGGLVGTLTLSSYIHTSYASGGVRVLSGSGGGLLGIGENSRIVASYASGTVITSGTGYVAGLVGEPFNSIASYALGATPDTASATQIDNPAWRSDSRISNFTLTIANKPNANQAQRFKWNSPSAFSLSAWNFSDRSASGGPSLNYADYDGEGTTFHCANADNAPIGSILIANCGTRLPDQGLSEFSDSDEDGVSNRNDVDDDNDGLIEIESFLMLRNIQYNLAGTSYDDEESDTTPADSGSSNGGPSSPTANCPTDSDGDGIYLCGYELVKNIFINSEAEPITWFENNDGSFTIRGGITNWSAIGTNEQPFTGIFEGNGFAISWLPLNRPSENYLGLFGVSSGTIRNIHMRHTLVVGRNQVGGLIGELRGGSVEGSSFSGTVVASGNNVGGLVGLQSSGTISGSFTNTNYQIGSENAGDRRVSGTTSVGGLVGHQVAGSIASSYAASQVRGSDKVGGLVGEQETGATVSTSYASGRVRGTSNLGSLIGTGSSPNASYGFGVVTNIDGSSIFIANDIGRAPNSVVKAIDFTASVAGTSWSSSGNWDFTQRSYLGGPRLSLNGSNLPGQGSYVPTPNINLAYRSYFSSQTLELTVDSYAGSTPEIYYTLTTDNTIPQTPLASISSRYSSDTPIAILPNIGSQYNLRFVARLNGVYSEFLDSNFAWKYNIGTNPVAGEFSTEQNLILTMVDIDGNSPSILYTSSNSLHVSPPDPRNPANSPTRYTQPIPILSNSGDVFIVRFVAQENGLYTDDFIGIFTRGGDIDRDNDGLIDIDNLTALHNIRYNLSGTSYKSGKNIAGITVGAPTSPTVNCSSDPDGDGAFLCGYELMQDLNFDLSDSDTSTWIDNGDGTYTLDADDNHPVYFDTKNGGWQPLGDLSTPFTAIFDGNGHTITGLAILRPHSDQQGLFGNIRGTSANIRNLHLRNTFVLGQSDVAALAGRLAGSFVVASSVQGRVIGNGANVGGLVGNVPPSAVSSASQATILGTYSNVMVSDYSSASTNNYGGLFGTMRNGYIIASYSVGEIRTQYANIVGGLVGDLRDSSQAIASMVTGNVISTGSQINAFAAKNDGTADFSIASYSFGTTTPSTTSSASNFSGSNPRPSDLTLTLVNNPIGDREDNKWNVKNELTLNAWDFASGMRSMLSDGGPGLRYADYDGDSNVFHCANDADIPAGRTLILIANCGSLLPGQQ